MHPTGLLATLETGAAEFAAALQGENVTAQTALSETVVAGFEKVVHQLEGDISKEGMVLFHDDFVTLRELAQGGKGEAVRAKLVIAALRLSESGVSQTRLSEAVRSVLSQMVDEGPDLDALVERYLKDFAGEEAQRAALKERALSAFQAGTVLRTLVPVEIYDPIDDRTIRLGSGEELVVAVHEGNVLVGELADNSHSLGVVYEEAHRWHRRKFFLPLALLVDSDRIEIVSYREEAVDSSAVKGIGRTGSDTATSVIIRKIEELALRDEIAFIPRGAKITLREETEATEIPSGEKKTLPAGTTAEVASAVGNIEDLATGEEGIEIRVGDQRFRISFDVLAALDPETDILTLEEQEAERAALMARRAFLFKTGGVALGAAMLGGLTWLRLGTKDHPAWEEEQRDNVTFSAAVSEASTLYGYFTAREHYWFVLRGILMNLRKYRSEEAVRTLANVTQQIASFSSAFYAAYREAFYNLVHVANVKQDTYSTDSKGNRVKTGEIIVPIYNMVWTEPAGLEGMHNTFENWANEDRRLARRSRYLLENGLFDLLAADAENAEADFAMTKRTLGVGRDAAIAAVTMGLMALPAGFADEIYARAKRGRWTGARRTKLSAQRGYFSHQKESLMAAGLAVGVALSQRSARRKAEQLQRNKGELGAQLETQIRRVPTLGFDAVWREFFDLDLPEELAGQMRSRRGPLRHTADHAHSFTYIHLPGISCGRALTPCFVDAGPVQAIVREHAAAWPGLAANLEAWAAVPGQKDRALPALQNGRGTWILEKQMAEDKGEAHAGSWNRSLAFGLPLWGAVLADSLLKYFRKP